MFGEGLFAELEEFEGDEGGGLDFFLEDLGDFEDEVVLVVVALVW